MARRALVVGASVAVAIAIAGTRRVSTHETVNTTVLFDREIVKVLNSHCVTCHVEGGPSFPLATYEEAWLQRRKISAAVIARRMPPWPAMPGYGRFANENVVTLRESQFVVSWMEGLGPRNSGKVFTNTSDPSAPKTAAVRAHADFTAWPLGTPDLERELDAIVVEPNQPDDIRRATIDLGLNTERDVTAIEFLPGDRHVVRAAFFTVQETGQWIGSWTPWHGHMMLPDGVVFRLPAGSHIAAEIHYQHTTARVVDRGKLGVFFGARRARSAFELVLDVKGLRAETTMPADTMLLALRHELPLNIRSLEVKARRPDGGTDVVLFAKDFSPKWPTPFIFSEPLLLRRGTILSATAYASGEPTPANLRLVISAARPAK